MSALSRRITVYLRPEIHRLLRLKAVETSSSVSEIVDFAVRFSLAEDAEDLQAFETRKHEPLITFEAVLRDLKAHGHL